MGREGRREKPEVEYEELPCKFVKYTTITGGGEQYTVIDGEDYIDRDGPFVVLTFAKPTKRKVLINLANVVSYDTQDARVRRALPPKLASMADGPAIQPPTGSESQT